MSPRKLSLEYRVLQNRVLGNRVVKYRVALIFISALSGISFKFVHKFAYKNAQKLLLTIFQLSAAVLHFFYSAMRLFMNCL